MIRINIEEVHRCITSIMGTVINQYGPVTNTEDYQWVIGVDVVKVIDSYLYPNGLPRDIKRTLMGIDIRIHMSDSTIIQLHRIISTIHLTQENK